MNKRVPILDFVMDTVAVPEMEEVRFTVAPSRVGEAESAVTVGVVVPVVKVKVVEAT